MNSNHSSATLSTVPSAVWIGDIEHIQIQTLFRGKFDDSILWITPVGKYR